MEVPSFVITTVALLLTIVLLRAFLKGNRNTSNDANSPPEPAGALPIIGHLHLLADPTRHLAPILADVCHKHGPVVSLWFGSYRTIIISSPEAIRECLTTNDKALASRPLQTSAGKYLNYNNASIAFAPYGPYLNKLRKLAVTKLLSSQKLKSLIDLQNSEVNSMINELYLLCKDGDKCSDGVLIGEFLERFTTNLITRMIAGKRIFGGEEARGSAEGERIGELMKEYMVVSGSLVASDLIPALGWTNFFGGPVKTMKQVARKLDLLVESWIEEHRLVREVEVDEASQDYIDVLLSAFQDNDDDLSFGHSSLDIIKANALVLIVAGADTVYVVYIWILANLLNNKRAMALAQQELDTKVGRGRWVEDTDMEKLVYLQAIVKETLRLYPPGPLAAPHEAAQDCCVAGYGVPEGTSVIFNLYKLHRDPGVWSDPNEFIPERFLNEKAHLDVSGSHFEYLPFGSGRRSCPGVNLAMQIMHLGIARLLQGFWMNSPLDAPVDMRGGPGLSMPKAVPLQIDLKLRLRPQMYQDLLVDRSLK